MKFLKQKLSDWFLDIPLVVVSLLGIIVTVFSCIYADSVMRSEIIERAQVMAQAVNIENVTGLSGEVLDINDERYIALKKKLVQLRMTDPEKIRFVYVMKKKGNEIVFLADSELETSEDMSPPGQIYEEVDTDFLAVFNNPSATYAHLSRDRWGYWMSAAIPIISSSSNPIAIIGLDVDAQKIYFKSIIIAGSVPFLVSLLMISIILATRKVRKEREKSLKDKAEVLSIASHEIRSPIAGIMWAIEGLVRSNQSSISQQVRTRLMEVHGNANLVMGRLNNLLALHRLERTDEKLIFSNVSLKELIDKSFSVLLFPIEQKRLTIIISEGCEKLNVNGDKDRLWIAISNVISNAVKYSLPETTIKCTCEVSAHKILLWIENESLVMSGDDISKVFEHHRGSKTSVETGNGMGLPLTKKIIEMHGGSVSFTSDVAGKTKVVITIPSTQKIA